MIWVSLVLENQAGKQPSPDCKFKVKMTSPMLPVIMLVY